MPDVAPVHVSAKSEGKVGTTIPDPKAKRRGFVPLRVRTPDSSATAGQRVCTPPWRFLSGAAAVRIPLATRSLVLLAIAMSACGIAPVTSAPGPPPTVAYVNPHGRPRAFGGGVCPVSGRHEHIYPPVPAAFFVDDAGAWRDTRPIHSFAGPHPWRGRGCAVARYHQHAIAPGDLDAPKKAP